MRRIGRLAVFVCALCMYVPHAHAAEFATKYNVEYKVTEKNTVDVTQNIQVTNLAAEYYLSKYTIDLGPQLALDAQASEKNKTLRTSVIQNASSSALSVEFADKTIGKGSTKSFSVTYSSENTVQKNGNLRTISIPRVTGTGISEYNITVTVPQAIGEIGSISPPPDEKKQEDGSTVLKFTTEQVTKSGIQIYIGTEQYYALALTYHLRNPQSRSVFTEIALPINTAYQKIVYESLTPKPQSITIDDDGNYIARYTMTPKQELDVQFVGKAIVYSTKQYEEPSLTQSQKQLYIQKQPYWETDDIAIATIAAKLRTPENIYDYVVKTLQYDTTKLGSDEFRRKGAREALKKPKESVCMEFTDLFIALARAAGIPAREINGYAYTTDPVSRPVSLSQDILHAWPEYYDEEKGWVQIDPTWQNTTKGVDYFSSFDLNHITFVRKGMSSEYPYPAGSYKSNHTESRDVLVSLADNKPEIREEIEIVNEKPKTFFAGNQVELGITVKNTGNVGVHYPVRKAVMDNDTVKRSEETVEIAPFSQVVIPLTSFKSKSTDDQHLTGTIIVNDKTGQIEGKVTPWYKSIWSYMAIIYGIGIPILCIVLYKNLHTKSLEKRDMI